MPRVIDNHEKKRASFAESAKEALNKKFKFKLFF
ncbi:hypothetical protein LNTAR_09806 [Lentisphaera araneosa HTCC2155]|uniref:Uncharacterized protein n=1 Tax=Lentisphaera araneosa HTCC2155 TaxID=313628 RepID=A6DSH4_9BACT|nr:hypothetical protein LNTAR_09806 [Lentisphaera araneosa HTCC2155]